MDTHNTKDGPPARIVGPYIQAALEADTPERTAHALRTLTTPDHARELMGTSGGAMCSKCCYPTGKPDHGEAWILCPHCAKD
jgi:hypothetical protein